MLHRQPCCVDGSFRRTVITFLLISHKPQVWSWNWIYRQKAHESNFSIVRLPNRNVVKFSDTNRKHFTVGDVMAFPIVKMENKNPQNRPFPLDYVDPYLIQQCLGPPHAPPQTAAPTVEALSHTYAVKSPLVTMAHAKCARKSTPPRGPIAKPQYLPHPCTRPIYDAKRHPDPIRRFSTTYWTDRQTDRPTYRSSTGKFDDYRLLRSESDRV